MGHARRHGFGGGLMLVGLALLGVWNATWAAASSTPQFSDVPSSHLFYEEIAWLADTGVTSGFPDGSFRPGAVVTRQSMAAYLHRFWLELGEDDPVSVPDPGFTDVPPSHLFYEDIAWLADAGITSGFPDGSFRPGAVVTRQSMAAYLHRFWLALGEDDPVSVPDPGFSDVPSSHLFYEDIAWSADAGITSGFPDGTFRPTADHTRQSTAASLYRFWFHTATVFTVNTPVDAIDASPANGQCATGVGACSLRAAVTEANDTTGLVIIELTTTADLGISGAREDHNLTGDLDVDADVAIVGHGHTIDGHQHDRVIDLRAGRLRIWGTTVMNGYAPTWDFFWPPETEDTTPGHGGGIRAGGPVAIYDSVLGSNRAAGSEADFDCGGEAGGRGGGVSSDGHDVVLRGVTFEANTTSGGGAGGGVWVDDADLSVMDSTFERNISSFGGAIRVVDATATVERSMLTRNEARSWYTTQACEAWLQTPGAGGAVATETSMFVIRDSEIDENLALGSNGGAIDIGSLPAVSISGPVIEHSTLSGNLATMFEGEGGEGGAVSSADPYELVRSTVSDNQGTWVLGTGAIVRGSIISSNGANDAVCQTPAQSGGYNLASGTSCGLTGPGDQQQIDPLLSARGLAGVPGEQVPYSNSPAVGSVPAGTAELCAGPAACNAGASDDELPGDAAPRSFTVTVSTDGPDASPGDGICATASQTCSLRAALDETNAYPTADQITLASDVTLSLYVPHLLDSGGDLVVEDDLDLAGDGHTVDAAGLGRVIDHRAGTLELDSLILTGGVVGNGIDGGGIRSGGGTRLHLIDSEISDNLAAGEFFCCIAYYSPSNGGGLFADHATIEIERSLFTGNDLTAGSGQAISARRSGVTLRDSTISGFEIGDPAIHVVGGSATIEASTVVAAFSAIELVDDASITVRGSILDAGGPVCSDPLVSGGYNLVSDASCGLTATGDVQGADPLLGALADNGGPTRSYLPSSGSPAVGAIPDGTALLCDAGRTDQRGVERPQGAGCDIGAVERTAADP